MSDLYNFRVWDLEMQEPLSSFPKRLELWVREEGWGCGGVGEMDGTSRHTGNPEDIPPNTMDHSEDSLAQIRVLICWCLGPRNLNPAPDEGH